MDTIKCALSELSLKSMARKSDVPPVVSSYVDTVVQLIRKAPDAYARVKMNMED